MPSPYLSAEEESLIARRMRELAVIAGRKTLEFFRSADLVSRNKTDGTPVSEADLAANTVIMDGLHASFPHLPVVSEEEGSDVPEDWAAPFFLIDPLDGTKEFIRGDGQYTVNIALIAGHAPLLGVVYAPAVGRLQWTPRAGEAAEERPPHAPDAVGELVRLACRTADNAALTAVLSRSHYGEATRDLVGRYAIASANHAGSSLKFCLLAAGEADFYPRLSPTMEWDTAAADAILRAAGGNVVDHPGGKDLIYGKPGLKNPFFIAHGPGVRLLPSGE
jgi:3'(2'), 5'-bisphosphate nucleotidase